MIPLRDNVSRRQKPTINRVLLGANAAAFLWQLSFGLERSIFLYGLVPAELSSGKDTPLAISHVFSSMFLHGGLGHLLFNLLFLWVFGPTLEAFLGKGRYLALYLGTGVAAALAQVALAPGSPIPMVGASGAIAGTLGAYWVLFPRAQVLTLVPIFIFVRLIWLPAWFFLGLWLLFQVLSAPKGGGIAFGAHIGGFLMGALVAWIGLWRKRRREYARWRRLD